MTPTSIDKFDAELERQLEDLRHANLHRRLRKLDSGQSTWIELQGRQLLNFSSNDYLGLASHPALKEAATGAIAEFGSGAGASRLVCGSLAVHHELEEALAEFKGTAAALSFSTGYAAAMGTICALLGSADVVILDKLVHACMVDAARLSSARLRIFPHNDLGKLEEILKWADKRFRGCSSNPASRAPRTLVVTESLFSMDGDCAPLRELVALKEKYGAWLMVDEAHATGLFGPNRRGLAEEAGVSGRIEVQMGTLGKAVGSAGGYICGSRALIEVLANRARTFVFSTAPVPAQAAAATAGIRVIRSAAGEQRLKLLRQRIVEFDSNRIRADAGVPGPILPILIGDEQKTLDAAALLYDQGIFVPAIRYPTVSRGKARLRITLSAAHSSDDVQRLRQALSKAGVREIECSKVVASGAQDSAASPQRVAIVK